MIAHRDSRRGMAAVTGHRHPNAAGCRRLRIVSWLWALFWLAFAGAAPAQDSARMVLHLLDYLAVDYPNAVDNGNIKNADEYKEMREFSGQVRTLLKSLPRKTAQSELAAQADLLAQRIEAKAPGSEIAARVGALRWAVIHAYDVQVVPARAPDPALGAALYAAQCAACHGAQGRGDGPAGKGLNPVPADFHDIARMAQRSVYGLYNTVTLGVGGTSMAAFGRLSDDERWALAFFVANFAAAEEVRARGAALWQSGKGRGEFPDLFNVTTLSATDIRARAGDDAVAIQTYLRATPKALTVAQNSPIEFTLLMLEKSLDAYRRGDRAEASQIAIRGYLEGFELVESSLKVIDQELMTRTERGLIAYRGLLQAGAPLEQVERQAQIARTLLDEARAKLDGGRVSQTTTFVSALVILLREGAEAILVIAAILAFLGKAGRRDARRWVHLGWIVAVLLGGLTWALSSYLVRISGADRELTEGVTALVSAAMLIYVGFWLHNKSHSAAWQKFIGDKVGGALSAGTLWTLAGISFLAVYREMFETVLFYEALAAQAGAEGQHALVGGVALGALLLVAVAWAILRASLRLPIGPFFSISGILLLIMAVAFTGQGIAALQEAGKISVSTIASVTIPMLGIYPTVETMAAQLAVLALVIAGFWWAGRKTPAPTGSPPAG